MACLPCEMAARARARAKARSKKIGTMAKRKRKSTRRKTTRRRRIGGFSGKLTNRKLTISIMDVLWILAGLAANFSIVNGLVNKVIEKLTKADGSPLLGEYQSKIIGILKTGTPAYLAYALNKLPNEVRLILLGISLGSGVETVSSFFPEGKLPTVFGTGDLFLNVGATPMVEIPINSSALNGLGDSIDANSMAVFGAGDLYENVGMPSL